MTLINLLVFFFSKTTYASLFKDIKYFTFTRFIGLGLFNKEVSVSLIYSKLTPLMLFIFFLTANFGGELVLLFLNSIVTLTSQTLIFSFLNYTPNLTMDILNFSNNLLNLINLIIYFFIFNAIKYIKRIFSC